MVEATVLNLVQRYLQSLIGSGIPVSFGVLFGSQVTGHAHEWSDIDLLVVSPRFDGQMTREDLRFLWIEASDLDTRIEPVPCGEKEWREDDSRMIVEIARRQGQVVQLPG